MPDLSSELVAERLDRMIERSRRLADSPEGRARMRERLRDVRRSAVVDMSPSAVDARIRRLAALRSLCLELAFPRGSS
jgi:hypothetical protein